jgi:hypothetical protein
MERCPELFELESFFEVSASASDGPDGAWFYDRVRFVKQRGDERVVCEMEAAEGAFSILHSHAGLVDLDVSLQYVCSLEHTTSAGVEHLIGRVSHGGVEQLFKLQLKPTFAFQLGTGLPNYSE